MAHDLEQAVSPPRVQSYPASRSSSSSSFTAASLNNKAGPATVVARTRDGEYEHGHTLSRTQSSSRGETDDQFLDEVENSLYGNAQNTRSHHASHTIHDKYAPSNKAAASTGGGSRLPSPSMDIADTLDDSTTFKRKLRAGLFYLACSTAHELMIYKIAQRTFWQTATFFLSFEYLMLLLCGGILTLYMRLRKSVPLQKLIGVNGIQLWPVSAPSSSSSSSNALSKDVLPLAALVVATASLRIIKDGLLDVTISTSISTYIAPTLLLLIPSIYLSTAQPKNGFLTLSAIFIPLLFGLALADLRVLPIGTISAIAFALAEAAKLAFAKKTLSSRGISPLETVIHYLPAATLLSLVTVLPLSMYNGAPERTPHSWQWYFAFQSLTSFLHQISTLIALNVFNTPVSVAFLTVPKGLLVTLFNGGITQAHAGASHEFAIIGVLAMLILIFAVPELRSRILREPDHHKDNYFMPLSSPSSSPEQKLLEQQEQHQQAQSPQKGSLIYISPRATRYLALASFIPLLYALIIQSSSPFSAWSTSKSLDAIQHFASTPTIDIVIAHYDESAEQTSDMIKNLKNYPWIGKSNPKVTLYMKQGDAGNETVHEEEMKFQKLVGADEVIHLKNRGREAGTYLQHIIRNYNESVDPATAQRYGSGLADFTLFMQPHLAWDWIARERLWLFRHDKQHQTGYLHFAPYVKLDCGRDTAGNGDFMRLHEIYNIFKEELCPPTLQLGAYSSQFVVSKKRILANSYHKYQAISDVLESEADHWIHKEGTWWKYHGEPGPENPYFGHAMERAWPTMFGCADPILADTCAGDNYNVTGCQCFD